MKYNIFLFNKSSRAANYGIGKYIEQFICYMKKQDCIDLTLIELNSNFVKEISEIQENDTRIIRVPPLLVNYSRNPKKFQYYTRNVVLLLKRYISDINAFFFLNYIENDDLAMQLKQQFKAKIILTAHYTNWSFMLFGDRVRLKRILKGSKESSAEGVKAMVENEKKLFEQCDKVICIAHHTYNTFIEDYKIDASKLVLINNGLRDEYHTVSASQKAVIRKRFKIAENEKIILFAGRLDEVKGIRYLLQAFRKLLAVRSDCRLVIVGSGSFAQWTSLSKSFCSRVSFTGQLSHAELYRYYRIADIGVVCSIHEEFGFVAVEMMKHALPTVVTDVGGLAEIIDDGVTGLKVPVRTLKGNRQTDVNVLADKILWLLEHPSQAVQIGVNARKKYLNKYKLSIWGDKIMKLLAALSNSSETSQTQPCC